MMMSYDEGIIDKHFTDALTFVKSGAATASGSAQAAAFAWTGGGGGGDTCYTAFTVIQTAESSLCV